MADQGLINNRVSANRTWRISNDNLKTPNESRGKQNNFINYKQGDTGNTRLTFKFIKNLYMVKLIMLFQKTTEIRIM
jgi:hypothetical protein